MDHLGKAIEVIDGVDQRRAEGHTASMAAIQVASVHAQIAQVEQMKRLADQLEAFAGDMAPLCVSVQGSVRTN